MPTLDLYKVRKPNTVKVFNRLTQKTCEYLIPIEYTVEEVERFLELQAQREKFEKVFIEKGKEEEQVMYHYKVVFDQIEILFQHHQPELNSEELKKILTYKDALDVLSFFKKYRSVQSQNDSAKKKLHLMS